MIILFEIGILVVLIIAYLLNLVSLVRTEEVLIGMAILDLILALLAYLGWPVLRGDLSSQSPINRQDTLERQAELALPKSKRPTRRFITSLLVMGLVSLGAGILLIFLSNVK